MEKIKFRAWDTEEKKMILPESVQRDVYDEKEYLAVTTNGEPIWIKDNRKMDTAKVRGFRPQDIVLMFFTGLTDKNGEDIYEGDIVRVNDPKFLRCREIDVIEFRSAAFFIGNSDDMSSLHNAQSLGTNMARLEVIGNIYENPELLEKELV